MRSIRHALTSAATLLAASTLAACGLGTAPAPSAPKNCTPAHDFKTIKEGVLTVVSFDLLPYTKVEGKNLTGVDGDIVNAIAKKECLALETVNAAAAAAIPMVQSGRADLTAADWYRTKARAKVVALSDPIYADQMALISKDGVGDIDSLKKLTVGTVDGYLWVDDLRKFLGSNLKLYANTPNVYADLKAGRIDVVVDGFGPGSYNGKGFKVAVAQPNDAVGASQNPGQSTFPMPMGNTALIKAVNEDIAELRSSGELANILKKHDLDPSAADPGAPGLL